ncbi:MAG: diaminopimelate epimerase [Cyanobacteria bacterium SIG26]|nr:diaminopimelate epimerase [Cyanobacteria bacterium SIG26]
MREIMNNTIKVTKMQGCGNDFVVLDYEEFEKANLPMDELAKKLCDRNFGIGADGMIIPDKTPNGLTDIAWHFYNSDGTTAQMCGNGMRCFAKYVYDKKLVNKKEFSVETLAGIIKPQILEDGNVKVNMGTPILQDEKIPFNGEKVIKIKDKEFEITPVSMGNPHCIIFTDEDPMYLAQNYGPDIEKHPYFPEKTNTEFVKIISRREIDMRVYERGCGITLACGTGACASVVASVLNNLTEQNVKVNLLGGAVNIEWSGTRENPSEDIFLIGPANYTFTADYML